MMTETKIVHKHTHIISAVSKNKPHIGKRNVMMDQTARFVQKAIGCKHFLGGCDAKRPIVLSAHGQQISLTKKCFGINRLNPTFDDVESRQKLQRFALVESERCFCQHLFFLLPKATGSTSYRMTNIA